MESLQTTNVWLGILAVVSLLEFLMIASAGVLAFRLYKEAMSTIQAIERVHIAPLRMRVDLLLDQVEIMTDTVKNAQESVSDTLRHVTGAGTLVAGAVRAKAWPILGIIQGLRSAANAIRKDGGDSGSSTARYGT
jgi:hypothetical protein